MKVKEIERTANVAWSPAAQYPVYLASGTAAQQLDATFSTQSKLEVFKFNPEVAGPDCELVASADTEHRFSKVVWGDLGMKNGSHSSGVIVGGMENGLVCAWDASKLIMQETDSQILNLSKHVGNVRALDFNKFQDNLLASGGSDSEIFLWDLNNPATPMTPGAKSQPSDDVTCLSWNCQVQHILASSLNTRCVVWDLRKSEPIIKISDSMSRIKSKLVSWHPEIATQLVLSSEDDHSPVIQLWDLRFAASPLKVLEKHTRGVLSMAWSRTDADMLISCGKDNKLLCWNPNTDVLGGEVTFEMGLGNQWCFDVQWCPRNPQCLSASSFDGRVSVYSVMGGEMVSESMSSTSKIADSFGGFDNMVSPHSVPQVEKQLVQQISKAPKWLKRPCGATFAFGGRLVTFSSSKTEERGRRSSVNIQTVSTETEVLSHSKQLEHAIHNQQFAEFCSLKIGNSRDEGEETLWQFLKVNFESNPRRNYLSILGFDTQEVSQKVSAATASSTDVSEAITSKMSDLTTDALTNGSEAVGDSDWLTQSAEELKFDTRNEGADSLITQALLTGNFEQAVELCLHEGRMADAIILANADGPALLQRTMTRYFKQCSGSTSSLISAVVQKDYKSVVDRTALENWKEALAVILTYSKPAEFVQLCDKLGARLEQCADLDLAANALLCYICSGNIDKFVDCWVRQPLKGDNSPIVLQELIEKVMMLRRAVEQIHGQEYSVKAGSCLAHKLGEYAELLAAEGSLQTALGYLTGVTQSQKLSVLKYRLQTSLGQQANSPWPKNEVKVASAQRQKVRDVSNPYANVARSQPTPQPAPSMNNMYSSNAVHTTSPVVSTYNTGSAGSGASYGYSQPYQPFNQPSVPVHTYEPPTQPSYAPSPGYNTGYSGYGQPQPSVGHVAARGLLSKKYTNAASTSASETQPASQAPTFFNPNAASSTSAEGLASYNPGSMLNTSSAPANVYQQPAQGYQPPAAPAIPVPSVDAARNAPSGWNDPPPVHGKEPDSPKSTAAPITMPVYTPTAQPYMSGDAMHVHTQQPASTGQPYYGAPAGQPSQYSPAQPHSPKQPAPPVEVAKPPLPERHLVLKETLDSLASKCLHASTNPQQKRKLEDVLRKLESLYDKLRNQTLSESILTGLHQIVVSIKQYDYQAGLAVHTHLVSQGNFSEISAFMPGLKMLMQTALHLQVFV